MAVMGVTVRRLGPDEWPVLREVRLRALSDAQFAFGSTFDAEVARGDGWWAASVEWLAWFVARDGPAAVGLVAGRAVGDDAACREIVSMWVAPEWRGGGAARGRLFGVLGWGRAGRPGARGLLLSRHTLQPRPSIS